MQLPRYWIDWLNTLLLVLAAVVAFVLPFEAFLFAYAVLGPLHYLTEISWLHERKYFATGKWDAMVLLVFACILFFLFFPLNWLTTPAWKNAHGHSVNLIGAAIPYLAFFAAVGMVVFQRASSKFMLLLLAGLLALGLYQVPGWAIFFAAFLPTIVHVFVFTLFFMIVGTIRSKSLPGVINVVLMVLISALLLGIRLPHSLPISQYVTSTYTGFEMLNSQMAYHFFGTSLDGSLIYQSSLGVAIMRFIAFAYTYHYLNWFSKTSIIKWHQVNRKRLTAVIVLWIVAVALYAWSYQIGFITLYTLSFLHVFLEFPLNWRSILELSGYCKKVVIGS